MSLLFYLVAALEQHSCSRELINSVKIEGARGSVVRSLWDFLKNKGGGVACLSHLHVSDHQIILDRDKLSKYKMQF